MKRLMLQAAPAMVATKETPVAPRVVQGQPQGVVEPHVDSIDVYLEYCAKLGRKPDKPVSGNFTVRIPQELHRDIQIMAASAHKSLNTWITGLLEEARNRQRHQLPL